MIMNNILVIKLNFKCSERTYKQIYENILKQMDVGLVVLPYKYDALVISRDCDVKVEGHVRKSSNYKEDENYGC